MHQHFNKLIGGITSSNSKNHKSPEKVRGRVETKAEIANKPNKKSTMSPAGTKPGSNPQ